MGDEFDHQLSVTGRVRARGQSVAPGQSRDDPFAPWRLRDTMTASAMVRTLKSKILPRIASAFRSGLGSAAPRCEPSAEHVAHLVNLVLGTDDDAPASFVTELRAQGASDDAVLLQLLAPAARRLGSMWEADTIDFGSVTIGVSRLQRLLHHCAGHILDHGSAGGPASALLATSPGDQHSFGLFIAAEYFRRAGWHLHIAPMATRADLSALVAEQWFDVVGFSVSSDRALDDLAGDIAALRQHSCNRQLGVMLGGQMVRERPGLAASVGADMVSLDVTIAARHATALLEVMKDRSKLSNNGR